MGKKYFGGFKQSFETIFGQEISKLITTYMKTNYQ